MRVGSSWPGRPTETCRGGLARRSGHSELDQQGSPFRGNDIELQVVTTITEYYWKFQLEYSLEAVRGVGADDSDRLKIWSGQRQTELKTSSKVPAPHPEVRSPAISKEAIDDQLIWSTIIDYIMGCR